MQAPATANSSVPLVIAGKDYEFIQRIIEQNKALAPATPGTWRELRNFCSFTGSMIWAFPVSKLMRWKIRRNKQLKQILQFKELIPVRNNIEKGSFAYDSLLFKENIFSLLKNKSHLANLVCLAILFGDEFIDGIAREFGKKQTSKLLYDPAYNFNLQFRRNAKEQAELFYEFDICQLLPHEVLTAVNSKYQISYAAFYQHLLFLLAEMNRQLALLPSSVADEASRLVCKVCNLCFASYREDITGFNENYSFDDLLLYQKTKDDDIVMTLLSLRAVLLEKKTLHYQKQFSAWSSMVRSMQLYDDMEDVAGDCDFQMNTCCWMARNHFSQEWQWLRENKETLKQKRGNERNAIIALHMPGSCMLVMQYARNISGAKLNWVQQKIINYLWRKNWLGFKNDSPQFSISQLMQTDNPSMALQIHFIYQKVSMVSHPLISNEMKKAWCIDIGLMDRRLRKYICSRISFGEKYPLLHHFLEWDTRQKAALLHRLA